MTHLFHGECPPSLRHLGQVLSTSHSLVSQTSVCNDGSKELGKDNISVVVNNGATYINTLLLVLNSMHAGTYEYSKLI